MQGNPVDITLITGEARDWMPTQVTGVWERKVVEVDQDTIEIDLFNEDYIDGDITKQEVNEILDILDQNAPFFLIDKQKYITFYWCGRLIVRININNGLENSKNQKQLHVLNHYTWKIVPAPLAYRSPRIPGSTKD